MPIHVIPARKWNQRSRKYQPSMLKRSMALLSLGVDSRRIVPARSTKRRELLAGRGGIPAAHGDQQCEQRERRSEEQRLEGIPHRPREAAERVPIVARDERAEREDRPRRPPLRAPLERGGERHRE